MSEPDPPGSSRQDKPRAGVRQLAADIEEHMQTTSETAGNTAGKFRSRPRASLKATRGELMVADPLAAEQTMETFHEAARKAWDAANAAVAAASAAHRAPRSRQDRRGR